MTETSATEDSTGFTALFLSLARTRQEPDADFRAAQLRNQIVAGDPLAAAEAILSTLRSRDLPAAIPRDHLVAEAADLLASLVESPPVLQRAVAALDDPATRAASLDAFAIRGAPETSEPLVSVVTTGRYLDWPDEDLVRLLAAFGSVGGREVAAAVAALQAHGGWSRAVEQELEVTASMLYDEDW